MCLELCTSSRLFKSSQNVLRTVSGLYFVIRDDFAIAKSFENKIEPRCYQEYDKKYLQSHDLYTQVFQVYINKYTHFMYLSFGA